MKAVVDQQTCIGCTLCTQSCADVFEMKGDKAIVRIDRIPQDDYDCARQAAEACPVQAITLSA